ncbi:MAG: DoxX family protein [Pyrinomonadaceae bacterium]
MNAMKLGDNRNRALILLRLALCALMFVHGIHRIANGGVAGFGEFLGSQGLPFGFYVAWVISIFEVVGSVLLALGIYTRIIALIFTVQIAAGIAMVHWQEGWFVVGSGRNGMEFSVLLMVGFLATALANNKR